jgi:hypothetical protein
MEKKKGQLADEFRAEFNALKDKIVKDTDDLGLVPVAELKDKITSIGLAIQDLKVKLQEGMKILPAYTAKVSFSNGYVVVFKRSHILILI